MASVLYVEAGGHGCLSIVGTVIFETRDNLPNGWVTAVVIRKDLMWMDSCGRRHYQESQYDLGGGTLHPMDRIAARDDRLRIAP
jgi:hypothetical protein